MKKKLFEAEKSDGENDFTPLEKTPQPKSKNDKKALNAASVSIKKKKEKKAPKIKKSAEEIRKIIIDGIEYNLKNDESLDHVSLVKVKLYAAEQGRLLNKNDLTIVLKQMVDENIIVNCTGKFLG